MTKLKVAALTSTMALLWLASPASAQAPDRHDHGPLFLPGVHYGAPLEIAAGLAVFFETRVDGDLADGVIVEGGAGPRGIRASFGWARFVEYMGLDARFVMHRTIGEPRGASSDSTYLGGEAGLTIAYVRVSVGAGQRIAGASGDDHRTFLTWTVGVHVPLGW
jgi:hypothetical protein